MKRLIALIATSLLAAALSACAADEPEPKDTSLTEEELAAIAADRASVRDRSQLDAEAEAAAAAEQAEAEAAAAAQAEAAEAAAAQAEADRKAAEDAAAAAAEREAAERAAAEAAQRATDADAARAALDLAFDFRDELNHGSKDAAHQRYIVLHDTEGGGSPEGVVQSWVNAGNRIAAHFVVGKDGHIVQCVPLDAIGHHAGWGDTGHNDSFGVPEDGRDDYAGTTERGSISWAQDYGMNAWSVGIELVHVGGEGDYPEAQLAALDGLIAYIDACFGGDAGTIIDHKMWRSGNSDTSEEFAGYLANYRDHRTHS